MRKIAQTLNLRLLCLPINGWARWRDWDAPHISELGDFFLCDFTTSPPTGNLLSLPSGSRQCAHSAPSLTASQPVGSEQREPSSALHIWRGEAWMWGHHRRLVLIINTFWRRQHPHCNTGATERGGWWMSEVRFVSSQWSCAITAVIVSHFHSLDYSDGAFSRV